MSLLVRMNMSRHLWPMDKFENMCEITADTTRVRATNYENPAAVTREYPRANANFTEEKLAALNAIEATLASEKLTTVPRIAFIDQLGNADLLVERLGCQDTPKSWILVYKHFDYA